MFDVNNENTFFIRMSFFFWKLVNGWVKKYNQNEWKFIFNVAFQIKVILFFLKEFLNEFLKKLSGILLVLPHLRICIARAKPRSLTLTRRWVEMEQTLWDHLPLLVRSNSKESVEYILQTLWRTRKTGLDAADRHVIHDVLQLQNDSDLDPVCIFPLWGSALLLFTKSSLHGEIWKL